MLHGEFLIRAVAHFYTPSAWSFTESGDNPFLFCPSEDLVSLGGGGGGGGGVGSWQKFEVTMGTRFGLSISVLLWSLSFDDVTLFRRPCLSEQTEEKNMWRF